MSRVSNQGTALKAEWQALTPCPGAKLGLTRSRKVQNMAKAERGRRVARHEAGEGATGYRSQ